MVLHWQQRCSLCLIKLLDTAVENLYNQSMEHPLIGSLEQFTAEQLLTTITELNRKLGVAQRMGNAHLCNQIRMAIESHQAKYQEKIRKDTDNNFDNVIDIS
jgi:hypothetical protein